MALLLNSGGYLRTAASARILLIGDPGAVFHVIAPAWRRADFGNGTTAVGWTSGLDPSELKAYTIDCTTEMNGIADRIMTVDLTLSGLATTAGLQVYAITNDETQITVWFQIDPAERVKPNWNPPGETHLITCRVVSLGGHVFERTISLKIVQLGQ